MYYFFLGTQFTELTRINCGQLPDTVKMIKELSSETLKTYDVMIDAVFGTGFHGELPLSVGKIFKMIHSADKKELL